MDLKLANAFPNKLPKLQIPPPHPNHSKQLHLLPTPTSEEDSGGGIHSGKQDLNYFSDHTLDHTLDEHESLYAPPFPMRSASCSRKGEYSQMTEKKKIALREKLDNLTKSSQDPICGIPRHVDEPISYHYGRQPSTVSKLSISEKNSLNMTKIIQWYCCQCGQSEGDLDFLFDQDESKLLSKIETVYLRFDCERCSHMMCPYCVKARLEDIA